MPKCNSYETQNIHPNLIDQQQFRINTIHEIKDYFIADIKKWELMIERLSKSIASFYFFISH